MNNVQPASAETSIESELLAHALTVERHLVGLEVRYQVTPITLAGKQDEVV